MRSKRIKTDLDEQLPYAEADLRSLGRAHLFITGGTGFVGTWILESISHANERLGLRIRATILTRNPEHFVQRHPHLEACGAFTFVRGDVQAIPGNLGGFDGIIHAATPASAALNQNAPFEMLDTILGGGRAVIELAGRCGSIPLLFTSSGAVYGPAQDGVSSFDESYTGGPDPLSPRVAYHEGKRVGEFQCAVAHQSFGIAPKIARLFAFVGPYLPMDRHLAVGNFIADARDGRAIHVGGDGTTVRSYQYAAEMVTWLWAVYARGVAMRAYNIGSAEAVTMRDLAYAVAGAVNPVVPVEIHGTAMPGSRVDRYVPATGRIREELGVVSTIPLATGIRRTLDFLVERS